MCFVFERYRMACELLESALNTDDELLAYLFYAAVICGMQRDAPTHNTRRAA